MWTIQVPPFSKAIEKKPKTAKAYRLYRFHYDWNLTEDENYMELDYKHAQCFFTKEDGRFEFIEVLKKLKFDLGVGGLYLSDSMLFQALNLKFLKVTNENLEAVNLQLKLGLSGGGPS